MAAHDFNDQQFQDRVIPKKVSNTINVGIFFAYASAVIQLFFSASGNKFGILFAIICVICAMGLQKFKSLICAILLMAVNIPAGMSIISFMGGGGLSVVSLWIGVLIFYGNIIAAVVKFHKIRKDCEAGVNYDFFEGKTFIQNPYEEVECDVSQILNHSDGEPDDFNFHR